jgi:tripartite-type tricarboxylate transporter receptor subunit TctC
MKRQPNFLTFIVLLALSLMSFGLSKGWSAEKVYPDRPINMIVPYAPGGGTDLGSKVIAGRISEFLGQPLISVYKPGAGGSLAASFVANAKPDGYTVLVGSTSTMIIAPIVKKLDYKFGDLIPAGTFATIPQWFIVKSDARWKTLKEFIDEEKKSPGKLKIGSYGKLTVADFLIELLNRQAGIKLTHIPYKSAGEVVTAVLGGHVDAGMNSGAGGLLESGQLRILAVAEEKRLDLVPDVPTFKECGYPMAAIGGFSLCFPRGTPQEIVDKFADAQEKAIKRYSKEITEGLRSVEMGALFLNHKDSIDQCKKDYDFFYKIAKELGVVAK